MSGSSSEQIYNGLVQRVREGDPDAFELLAKQVENYRKRLCRQFFLPGADREDLEQEAMLGFAQAVADYQPGRGVVFTEYAMMCMRNAVVASVRKATRNKHQLLNQACSLEPLMAAASRQAGPEEVVANRSLLCSLFEQLRENLSSLELTALIRRAEGVTVREIARALDVAEKNVENALFRARKKAKQASLALA